MHYPQVRVARTGTPNMQRRLTSTHAESVVHPGLDVEILSVATANPEHKLDQRAALEAAKAVFPHLARMDGLYASTGIETRYCCEPSAWHQQPHGWEERTDKFQRHALALLEKVSVEAVAAAGLALADIDMLVVNTITGLAIPSLDARLMNRLDFRPNIERLPIFGLGCGGGVAGLARAARLAQGNPGANVLFLTVDLCTLCARPNDPSVAMFVSAALFGDGAAGVVLRGRQDRRGASGHGTVLPRIRAIGEHCWRKTEHIMGWDIKDDGFGVVLSPELPGLMRRELRPALDAFLDRNGLELESFEGFLLHPGGRKILETAEEVLGFDRGRFRHSWAVLRDYGNMSSATALFILQRALQAGDQGPHLLAAFGPGFSAYFVALEL
jgi:alkylresorcinol/alkylpyrone synthase